jgi:NTP pyrophosphatase (non-canonical NTP hydrolase)
MKPYQPIWATKPKHKKNVIVTSMGWAVEETGELLVRVRDLDIKLAELGLYEEEQVVDVPNLEKKDEVTPPVKKKAGRPKKVKTE